MMIMMMTMTMKEEPTNDASKRGRRGGLDVGRHARMGPRIARLTSYDLPHNHHHSHYPNHDNYNPYDDHHISPSIIIVVMKDSTWIGDFSGDIRISTDIYDYIEDRFLS